MHWICFALVTIILWFTNDGLFLQNSAKIEKKMTDWMTKVNLYLAIHATKVFIVFTWSVVYDNYDFDFDEKIEVNIAVYLIFLSCWSETVEILKKEI